jgi:hypothetical protein
LRLFISLGATAYVLNVFKSWNGKKDLLIQVDCMVSVIKEEVNYINDHYEDVKIMSM